MDAFARILNEAVANGDIIGGSARIVHNGKDLFRGSAGFNDNIAGTPFALDGIMCMFSLTKMVLSVAALKLFEQGYFQLDDPVGKFIPAYHEATVLSYPDGFVPVITKAKKPVTMRHLFTMTSGYPYPTVSMVPNAPRGYAEAGLRLGKLFGERAKEAETSGHPLTTLQVAELIAQAPMCFEPGEGWLYGHGSDILGAVVCAISGKSLAEFLKDEIFTPLGMVDTAYMLSDEQMARRAIIYDYFSPGDIKPYHLEAPNFDRIVSVPTEHLQICSSSLYSTLDDYSRFIQMLCNMGSLDGVKILGRKTVELMTADHLTPAQREMFTNTWFPSGSASWGLMACVAKTLTNASMMRFPGSFGWSGAAGTVAWADPKENLSITFMTQRMPSASESIVSKLMQVAYARI